MLGQDSAADAEFLTRHWTRSAFDVHRRILV
jgi:hypothetical protein